MKTTHAPTRDASGRPIPPPPGPRVTFSPNAPTPAYTPDRSGAYAYDTRHAVGNITARERRDGNPRTMGEWRRLMAAPTGR